MYSNDSYKFLFKTSCFEAMRKSNKQIIYIKLMDDLFDAKLANIESLDVLAHIQSALLKCMPNMRGVDLKYSSEAHLKKAMQLINGMSDNKARISLKAYSYYIYSTILRGQNNFEGAVEHARRAVSLFEGLQAGQPIIVHALCELGLNLNRAKDYNSSRDVFKRVDQMLAVQLGDTTCLSPTLQFVEAFMTMNNGNHQLRIIGLKGENLVSQGKYQDALNLIDETLYTWMMEEKSVDNSYKAFITQVRFEAFKGLADYEGAKKLVKPLYDLLVQSVADVQELYKNWHYLRLTLSAADVSINLKESKQANSQLNEAKLCLKTLEYNSEHDFMKSYRELREKQKQMAPSRLKFHASANGKPSSNLGSKDEVRMYLG